MFQFSKMARILTIPYHIVKSYMVSVPLKEMILFMQSPFKKECQHHATVLGALVLKRRYPLLTLNSLELPHIACSTGLERGPISHGQDVAPVQEGCPC